VNKRKLIAFDYDGVLVDSLKLNLTAANQAFQRLNLPLQVTSEHMEQVENMTFEAMASLVEIPPAAMDDFLRLTYGYLADKPRPPAFFPGMAEFIPKLADHYLLAVVTGNEVENVKAALSSAGLLEHFQTIVGGESIPKAEKLKNTLNELGVSPASAYMIGDAVSDLRQAKLAGVNAVAVSWGYQSLQKLSRENPDLTAETPQHLFELFNL
jgi:phosphoglycolate phosphatase-like HAD superfamily hydrolase